MLRVPAHHRKGPFKSWVLHFRGSLCPSWDEELGPHRAPFPLLASLWLLLKETAPCSCGWRREPAEGAIILDGMKTGFWSLRRTRIPSCCLLNSVIPANMTASSSQFSQIQEPGLEGTRAGRDRVGRSSHETSCGHCFTGLLSSGSKNRNPSLERGRERWALPCRTQPFI